MTDLQQQELKSMQDSIYREKVMRARGMTEAERVQEVFEQSELQMQMMLAGAMHQLKTNSKEEGWNEVNRWQAKLEKLNNKFLTDRDPQS